MSFIEVIIIFEGFWDVRYFIEKMTDRARGAEARAQRRQEAAEAVVAGQDMVNEEDSDDNEELEEAWSCSSKNSTWFCGGASVGVGSRDVAKHG